MSIFTAQTGAKITIMDVLELFAAILGAISVYFVVQRNILAFPVGILMVIVYIAVFYRAKFYADMGLQVVYIVMQIQGWYEWSRGDRADDDKIAVRNLSDRQWRVTGLLLAVGTLCIGYTMQRFTDASLPWMDAFTTTLSLLAQWWMNKKFLENWILWIAVDVVYLYQYSYKALYFTTALYAVFLGLAIWGYFEWRKKQGSTQRFQDHQHSPGKRN
jgi:nicotinamide mononucleotide transporter